MVSTMRGPAQRLIESVVIAAATSTGLYLVGSVYTEAYFGRMSIDVSSLDLSPPYIALQSTHVLPSLLQYPLTLLTFFVIYRLLTPQMHRLISLYHGMRQRFGRLFLLLINVAVVSPLIIAAIRAGGASLLVQSSAIVSEIAELMDSFGVLMIGYVIWLSFGPRQFILSEIRQRKLVPILLLSMLYLLDSLIATAHGAALDAEMLMTGNSDSSIAITFTMANEQPGPASADGLLLVTMRNGHYFVVERQPLPPSRRPVAYVVPFDEVRSAAMQRVNRADLELDDADIDFITIMASPIAAP